ncbi:VWA domain-containing protein [Nocardia asteroides]|uniref:VWA domain-containing protein n=1 Tax=Nocardia asteroides TaxID=1824 RepID=UPI001E2D2F69|nr:VWA domain-containing protein [Nocardia asteroides]UGT60571.1 VWA domain-containing protein [Nocardia asteroides]
MATALTKGQNGALPPGPVTVAIRSAVAADVAALLVTAGGKVRSDADFVFFNQPQAPGVALRDGVLTVDPAQLPAEIAQVRVVLTLDDPSGRFGDHPAPVASVTGYEYVVAGLSSESVVIALELYRRGADWKVRAVGQGYAGGFADLVTDHGVSVDDGETAPPVVRSVPGEAKLSLEKRQTLDLRKREVSTVLHARQASDVRARVVLVLDKTGSMAKQYHRRVVHRVVERMVPIAIQLDDDGTLEPYLYALKFAQLPEITVEHAERWCETFLHLNGVHGGIDYGALGARNEELPIIGEIISTLRRGGPPTLVLFFTDGGFAKKREIAELMRTAAELPAFWQFVGLGKANYGLLRSLDEMDGRVVDNAGFFALDDVDLVDDAELYARLLGEFPDWLRAARAAGITG